MAKYNTEFKMKVVKEYLEGNIGYNKLAKKYSIPNKCVIQRWVSSFKTQGYDGIKVSRRNNNYSLDFKLNVVNLYLKGEMSYQSLADELNINNPSIITRWVIDFREKGIEGLKPKKRGRPSKMPKTTKNTENYNKDSNNKLTDLQQNQLTERELKEEIKKLKEKNYWLELENAAIKKKIEFSQMTQEEIDEYLRSLDC